MAENIAHLAPSEISQRQNLLVDQGNLVDAEKLLKSWLSVQNENPRQLAELEIARILFWQGKLSESSSYVEMGVKEGLADSWVFSLMGQIECGAGNYAEAEQYFRKALSIDAQNHEAKTFLEGDSLDQAEEIKRFLTHRKLSPRDRIHVLTLCAAVDFKRKKIFQCEKGELTQQTHDRKNLLFDYAEVGQLVEGEVSLRERLNEANEIIFYTSTAFGDAILGLSAIQALSRYFDLNPGVKKPVEIVTPFAELFTGLTKKYPFIKVKKIEKVKNEKDMFKYKDDLQARGNKTFVITNGGDTMYQALNNARYDITTAIVDLHIDRYARDIRTWHSPKSSAHPYMTYSQRMFRFMEMVMGQKLVSDPASISVDLPLSEELITRGASLLKSLGLENTRVHCINEAASQESKKINAENMRDLLIKLAQELNNQERSVFVKKSKILFLVDPFAKKSFLSQLDSLPAEVRSRIVTVNLDFNGVASLLYYADSMITPDTGIAHLSSALGKRTLILFTAADPYLWNTGGSNVDFLASPHALEAHDFNTPVNMPIWSDNIPIADSIFHADSVLNKWKQLLSKRILGH